MHIRLEVCSLNCGIAKLFIVPLKKSCMLLTCWVCGLPSPYRLARGREEWESAALQNANTKCNGLLPVWGPHVPESAFATCLARWVVWLLMVFCTWVRWDQQNPFVGFNELQCPDHLSRMLVDWSSHSPYSGSLCEGLLYSRVRS